MNRMKCFVGLISLVVATSATSAQSISFNYTAQDHWPGICVTGNTGRQSPINIITDLVNKDHNLTSLEFNCAYYVPINGQFGNKGNNVRFSPASDINGIMTTPRMLYIVNKPHLSLLQAQSSELFQQQLSWIPSNFKIP